MADPIVNPTLASAVFGIETGLKIGPRGQMTSSNDVEITTKLITSALTEKESPAFTAFLSQLKKNGQSIYLSADHLHHSPLTAYDIQKQLKDPRSLAFKVMMSVIITYVRMILDLVLLQIQFSDSILMQKLIAEVDAQNDTAIDRRYQANQAKKLYILQVNCLLLAHKMAYQKAKDYLFLCRFAKTPEDVAMVKQSIVRRFAARQTLLDDLTEQYATTHDEKIHELIAEQFGRLTRCTELSAELMQAKILGDVVTHLLSEGVCLEKICLKFETAELAANQAIRDQINRIQMSVQSPRLAMKLPPTIQEHALATDAYQIHQQLTAILQEYDDNIDSAFAELENGGPLSKRMQAYLDLLENIPKQQHELVTLLDLTYRLSQNEISDYQQLTARFNSALDNMRTFAIDQKISELLTHVENECGQALTTLQTGLNNLDTQAPRIIFTRKMPTVSVANNQHGFFNSPKQAPVIRDERREYFQNAQRKAVERFAGQETLHNPKFDANLPAIERCLKKCADEYNPETTDLRRVLVALKENFADLDLRNRNSADVLKLLDQLDLNEVKAAVLAIPCIASIVAGQHLGINDKPSEASLKK